VGVLRDGCIRWGYHAPRERGGFRGFDFGLLVSNLPWHRQQRNVFDSYEEI